MEFIAANYPDTPGVYLMKDETGRIIYVGKAISLRRRLASYFRANAGHSPKTIALVRRIDHIDVLLVSTEKEALLLEESLIKKHRPRYNIVLRDDKRSLLFRLDKRSEFPRLTFTRTVSRDGSAYFGPFSSATAARDTLKLVGLIFPLRKCPDRMFKNRVRPCLYHQLGQCLAPCVLPVDKAQYRELVVQVEQFLSGRSGALVRELKHRMAEAAEAMHYERAAVLRDQIRAIEQTLEGQASVLQDALDRDVLAVAEAESGLGLGMLFVRGGRLLEQKTRHWQGLGPADAAEALESFLAQYYSAGRYIPGRVLVSNPPEGPALAEVLAERRGGAVRLAGPRGTDERRLMEMAVRLAASARPADAGPDVAAELAHSLGLAQPPQRIECVDISHLAGRGVRAGLVVFEAGAPLKSAYRSYTLPAAEGTGDDYAALAQWAARRVKSGPPWPDLLLIDGGRGQLAAVVDALAKAGAEFPCASIAKGPSRRAGELEDRIFLPGRKNPAGLKPGSPGLLFLQRVRDEAHRYVIGKGRAAARRLSLTGGLDTLPGVGRKTARLLFDHFGDMAAIRVADVGALAALPGLGPRRAEKLRAALDALPPVSAMEP
jgi:excinuclease ABC subunit C